MLVHLPLRVSHVRRVMVAYWHLHRPGPVSTAVLGGVGVPGAPLRIRGHHFMSSPKGSVKFTDLPVSRALHITTGAVAEMAQTLTDS